MEDNIFSDGINPSVPRFLFDIEPCELDLHVGRRCRVLKKSLFNPFHYQNYTIAAVQKDAEGKPCYRLVADGDADNWGFPMSQDNIEFID
jgi:hypothetical protein